MAVYRFIHINYWQDGFVLDLTPREKYFYIYLMTNSKTTQCGIYELPKRIIEIETGYDREVINELIDKFIRYKKIMYDEITKEIFIINWIKHNQASSPNVKKCIAKELLSIKNEGFVKAFLNTSKGYGYDFITYFNDLKSPYEGVDILNKDPCNKEKEKEKQKEKEKINKNKNNNNAGDKNDKRGYKKPSPKQIKEFEKYIKK